MTPPAHELSIDADNGYRCTCGETGTTWAEIKPHVQATIGTATVLRHALRQPSLAERLLPDVDSLLADDLPAPERAPYDEDAAQDAIAGRPHWGSTLVPFVAAAEPELTCQSCGHVRDDHQLRGHPFVIWFKP